VNRAPKDSLEVQCINAAKSIAREYEHACPPYDVQPLLDHFNISEIRERPIDRDARLVFQDGRLAIEVNPLFPANRRRLSLAHELGHLLINHCSGDAAVCADHGDSASEALCNRLAGELLAPESAVIRYFEDNPTLATWQDSVRCSSLVSAAAAFGISVDAMACRVFHDLKLARSKVALVWRYCRNSDRSDSECDLRLSSLWHCIESLRFIPRNKTAPTASVIRRAFQENGVVVSEEYLCIGSLKGNFLIEAVGIGNQFEHNRGQAPRGVLAVVSL
jgi:hypothetical protein